MKNKSLLMTIAIFLFAINLIAQPKRASDDANTFTDSRDGKKYKTVKIGTQTWMAENLAYKTNSGCWAYEESSNNVAKYGYLYDWETAKSACPKGWHLPSDEEWTTLTDYLGGANLAAGVMKATTGWTKALLFEPTNESGFTALPAGNRDKVGKFDLQGSGAFFWSSTPASGEFATSRSMYYFNGVVSHSNRYRICGNSVRCIKDE
jgi:uncharacterized protein (TIGR02145 family)